MKKELLDFLNKNRKKIETIFTKTYLCYIFQNCNNIEEAKEIMLRDVEDEITYSKTDKTDRKNLEKIKKWVVEN